MALYMTDESGEEEFLGTEVTTSHYVSKSERKHCQRRSCDTSFVYPSLRRPHHCRRCGEIFCRPCLQYKRRLNTMAQPDPNGVLCKVCLSCFEDRGICLGCTSRDHSELFRDLRKQTKEEMLDIVYEYAVTSRRVSEQPTFWREQFKVDILKECQRLVQGFKSSMRGSGTINTLHEIKDHMNVPHWQKSTFWTLESHMTMCRQCGGKLGHRKKMRNCRVCGLALCKSCSCKELLLYFKDGTRHTKTADAHLSIIRISGCPDNEPQCSLLLNCCKDCKKEIINRQIEDETWYFEKPKHPDLESEIIRLDHIFQPLVEDIREDLNKLPSEIDDLDIVSVCDSLDHMPLSEAENQTVTVTNGTETQFETIKGSVCEKLKTYLGVYSKLRSVIKQNTDKLSGKTFDFVMNYATARKDFYIESETKFTKLSKNHEMFDTFLHEPIGFLDGL